MCSRQHKQMTSRMHFAGILRIDIQCRKHFQDEETFSG